MELYAKGQLSYLILTCLQDRDFYGLDIISEISSRSNGKINLKKPSVYSNLTRMEKQGYVSSYLQSSDFGPNRKYYSLTDKGRGFYAELKAYFDYNNIDVFRDFVDENVQNDNFLNSAYGNQNYNIKVVSDALDNQLSPKTQEDTIELEYNLHDAEYDDKRDEEQNDFFDFSSVEEKSTSSTLEETNTKENDENLSTKQVELTEEISQETEETHEIVINQEIQEEKDDARFLIREEQDDIEEKNISNENKIIEELEEEHKEDDAVFLPNENIDEYNKRLFDISKDINKIKRKRSFAEDQISITATDPLDYSNEKKKANIEEFKNSLLENKARYSYQGSTYNRPLFDNRLEKKEEEKAQDAKAKDDAVLITGRISLSDVGQARKIDPPRIKIVSENTKDTRLPAPKRDTNVDPSHREILNKLYSKTKDSSSIQPREDAIYDYNDLKDFYESQNISFNVYKKSLEKFSHNTNLLYLSISLGTLLISLLFSTLLYVIFLRTGNLNYHTNFLFILLPALLLLDVGIKIYNYKVYTSWLPTQMGPQWRMWCFYFLISCVVVGLNLICGIATKSFSLFATTLILPLVLAFVLIPLRYYIKRFILIRYWK